MFFREHFWTIKKKFKLYSHYIFFEGSLFTEQITDEWCLTERHWGYLQHKGLHQVWQYTNINTMHGVSCDMKFNEGNFMIIFAKYLQCRSVLFIFVLMMRNVGDMCQEVLYNYNVSAILSLFYLLLTNSASVEKDILTSYLVGNADHRCVLYWFTPGWKTLYHIGCAVFLDTFQEVYLGLNVYGVSCWVYIYHSSILLVASIDLPD
jgi:hypothetical protein